MAFHNDLGKKGELLAKQYLLDAGYEILDENWTYGKAEIDLIVLKNRIISFVEVKTRSSISFGAPEDFVNEAKIKQMEMASFHYIEMMNHQNEISFDIIAITFNQKNKYTIKHIKDAFWPEN